MPDMNTYTPNNWLSRASSTERASSAEKVKARVVVPSWDLSAPRASEGEGGKAGNATTGSNWLDMGRSRPASTLATATPRSLACSRQSDRHDTQRTVQNEFIQKVSMPSKHDMKTYTYVWVYVFRWAGLQDNRREANVCLPSHLPINISIVFLCTRVFLQNRFVNVGAGGIGGLVKRPNLATSIRRE